MGHDSGRLDVKKIRTILYEYRRSDDLLDLVFSSEFSKEERAQIHM